MPIVNLSPTFFDRYAVVDTREDEDEFIGWRPVGGLSNSADQKDLERTGAMTFPMAAVPAGVTITSVKLTMYYTANSINTNTLLIGPGSGNIIDFNSYPDNATGASNFVRDTQNVRENVVFSYAEYTNLTDDDLLGFHDYIFNAAGISDLQATVDSAQDNFSIACFDVILGGSVTWKTSTHTTEAHRPILEVTYTTGSVQLVDSHILPKSKHGGLLIR